MNTRHYLATGGAVAKALHEFCADTAVARKARLKLCEEAGGDAVKGCEGSFFGILFPEGHTPDPKQWRWHKQLEAWVPRKGTKEGKALHAHFYTKETEEPTGLDLAHRLQLDLFPEGMGMCTPGFHKLDDGRWLLNTADTRWTPPEGCKRISDIEYEALIEADERRSNMTPS